MHVLIAAVSSATAPTGICRHAANLARGLAEEDGISKVTLAVGSWQTQYFLNAFRLDNQKIHLTACPIGRGAIERNLWYLNQLPTLAKLIAAEVVHLSFPVPVLRPLMPCPVIATIHDLYPYDEPRNFAGSKVIFNRWFLHCCLRNSDALVCVSDFTLNRLALIAPSAMQRAQRIYNCVTAIGSISKAAPVEGLANRPFLLAVAQHRANKNLNLLLRAFAKSREQRLLPGDCALVLVGSAGPQTLRLMKIIEQGSLARDVFMLSAISDGELGWLYRNAALLVVASRIEGFCLPVIEALHEGCRVLCSDIPVLREIGGSACHYFDLKTIDHPIEELTHAVAAAIEGPRPILSHPERFSLANMTDRYIKLYSSIRRSAPPASMLVGPPQGVDRHVR